VGVKCFFVEPTPRAQWLLFRRTPYVRDGGSACPRLKGEYSCHWAYGGADIVEREITPGDRSWPSLPALGIAEDDARWPAKCESCDFSFTPAHNDDMRCEQLYRAAGSDKDYLLRDARKSPGMMWDAFWAPECWKGPDGRSLIVVCPDGTEWNIDGPCSNCTMKDDQGPYGQAHRCWTRTGTPPLIQVGKQFSKTCSAGGGSIAVPGYHGFLGTQGAQPRYFT
jgi:hypothetical protein